MMNFDAVKHFFKPTTTDKVRDSLRARYGDNLCEESVTLEEVGLLEAVKLVVDINKTSPPVDS